jgi:hypothetical protein
MLDKIDLTYIDSFHEAVSQLRSIGAFTAEQNEQLTGFGLLPGNRKQELVGVPFLIIQYEFKAGKNDSSFVECYIVTTNDERHIMRDSSRGIHEQLLELLNDRIESGHPVPNCGVYVRKGLTYRDNPYTSPSGEQLTTRTYFLT